MQGTRTNGELTGEMWETIPILSLPLHFRVRKQMMFGTIEAASFAKRRRVVNEKQWPTDGVHATGAPHGGSKTASSPAGPANPPSDSESDSDSVTPPASGGSAVTAPSADNANAPNSGYASTSVFGGALHGFWGYVRPGDDADAAAERDLPSVT